MKATEAIDRLGIGAKPARAARPAPAFGAARNVTIPTRFERAQLKAAMDADDLALRESRPFDAEVRGQLGPQGDVYQASFNAYLARGAEALTDAQQMVLQHPISDDLGSMSAEVRAIIGRIAERRDIGASVGTAGGYLVPQTFSDRLFSSMKLHNPLARICTVMDTPTGATMPIPAQDDTATVGTITAENSALTGLDYVFAQRSLGSFLYATKLEKVSWQLYNDAAYPLADFLADQFGQRLGRGVGAHLTTGSGAGSQPEGAFTNATVGVTGATGTTTTVKWQDLVSLTNTVNAAYRYRGYFVLHPNTLAAIQQLVDSSNRPLWVAASTPGEPGGTILGYPVLLADDAPVMAANAKSILFGDFTAGYVFRRVGGVRVVTLVERAADILQRWYFAYGRYDGAPSGDTKAYRAYQNSAT